MGRKVCLRYKGKTFCFQKFVDITQQCFALLPQVNFPAKNLNFHWRWWDQIFLNLFYFTYIDLPFDHCKIWKQFSLRNLTKNRNIFQFSLEKKTLTLLLKKVVIWVLLSHDEKKIFQLPYQMYSIIYAIEIDNQWDQRCNWKSRL